MSWLHCFWGVGTIISPYIMSYALTTSVWQNGYRMVSFLPVSYTHLVQSETDKRKTLLFLTEKAHALKDEYDSVSDKMGSIYYKGFSEEEDVYKRQM